jgi:hypothetical protein
VKFENFNLVLLRLTYICDETILMPEYKGNVLRGGFGAALKSVSCTRQDIPCLECMLKYKCAYCQIFETLISKDNKYLSGRETAPHPFIIEPTMETKREYLQDEKITFQIVLIGKAIEYIPYFILAFHTLGQWGLGAKNFNERGKGFLESVESVNIDDSALMIYDGEYQRFCSEPYIITADDICESSKLIDQDQITLEFITPTRIKTNNRFQDNIEFEMIIRGLIRRLMTLSFFHCGHEPELDYKGLVERSNLSIQKTHENICWVDWSRYSRRQDTEMMLGGIIGNMTFEGDLNEFLPILSLGKYIHIGKGTAFGLGKYVLQK